MMESSFDEGGQAPPGASASKPQAVSPATDVPQTALLPGQDRNAPTFDVLPLSPELRETLSEIGYVHPTPVQIAVWEPATRGRDAMVQARTGTGKTAAFGMPVVDYIVRRSQQIVQVLALCPTRELALQVTGELERLGKRRNVRVAPVYGGAGMQKQIDAIDAGAHVVVGTPGRVLDHLRRGTLSAKGIRLLVLDECDEMLSMGFERELNAILDYLPQERQTLLFSATLPPDIERLSRTKLKNPEIITLSGDHIGALEIQHFVYMIASDKLGSLLRILDVENPESAIIFCNTKEETERVSAALSRRGFDAEFLNGDLPQAEREVVMAKTRESRLRFLVATDVAARGIDISHLTHVINYDFPQDNAAYVHRTGRTGRAGRTGTAISLITPHEIGALYFLRLEYKIRPIERQIPSEGELRTRAETDLVQMLAEAFSPKGTHPDDLALARRLLTHDQCEAIIAGLVRDHLGARPSAAQEAAALRRSHKPEPVSASESKSEPKETREVRGTAHAGHREPRPEGRPGTGRRRSEPSMRAAEAGQPKARRKPSVQSGEAQAAQEELPKVQPAESHAEPLRAAAEPIPAPAEEIPTPPLDDETPAAPAPEMFSASQDESAPAPAAHDEREIAAAPALEAVPKPSLPAEVFEPSADTHREPPTDTHRVPSLEVMPAEELAAAPEAMLDDTSPDARMETPESEADVPEPESPELLHGGRAASPKGEFTGGFEGDAWQDSPPEEGYRGQAMRFRPHRATEPGRGGRQDYQGGRTRERRGREAPPGMPDRSAGGPYRHGRRPAPDARPSPPGAAQERSPSDFVRHSDFVRWELPEEEGDDLPILGDAPNRPARRPMFPGDRREEGAPPYLPPGAFEDAFVEIYVNVGRRDGARASDLQRILVERAGLDRNHVQRIRVRERNAFISVPRDDLGRAIHALNSAIIAGKPVLADVARDRSASIIDRDPEGPEDD